MWPVSHFWERKRPYLSRLLSHQEIFVRDQGDVIFIQILHSSLPRPSNLLCFHLIFTHISLLNLLNRNSIAYYGVVIVEVLQSGVFSYQEEDIKKCCKIPQPTHNLRYLLDDKYEAALADPTLIYCAGIHEHCTVAEILVFGRETGFPTQTLQRWYIYQSPQEMETKLINVNKSCYLVFILDSHSKRLLLSFLSYPGVNTI